MSYYESPAFKLIKKEEPFELRAYQAFYLVEYENDADPDSHYGFNTLFSYIGSNNSKEKKISMTVPVIEEVSNSKRKMSFVVPKKFGQDIPKPRSKFLKVVAFEAGYYAVVVFNGRSTEKLEAHQLEQLHNWIKKNQWAIDSEVKLAFYNAPFTPGPFRRNEMMIKVNWTAQ